MTISFGHADGQRVHRAGAHQAALGAAEAERAVEPALGEQPQADGAHPGEHALHGGAARAGAAHPVELVARRRRDLGVRDVRHDPRGLAEDPGVDHDRPRPEREQPVADVGDLGALGVERADQRDPGALRHARLRGPACRGS